MQKSNAHDRLAVELKAIREKAGLSQRALALKLGTNQTRISFVECGDQFVHVTEMIEWCHAVGVDPLDVLKAIL